VWVGWGVGVSGYSLGPPTPEDVDRALASLRAAVAASGG
jgi:hypothetical protein